MVLEILILKYAGSRSFCEHAYDYDHKDDDDVENSSNKNLMIVLN